MSANLNASTSERQSWLDSITPAVTRSPPKGRSGEHGRRRTFSGMTPRSAAQEIERIDAVRSMLESATGEHDVLSRFGIGEGTEDVVTAVLTDLLGGTREVEHIDGEDRPEVPTTATPPTPDAKETLPAPTEAAPPNPVPRPPAAPSPEKPALPQADAPDGYRPDTDALKGSVVVHEPFAGVMGTEYKVYVDTESKAPKVVEIVEEGRIIATIEIQSDGSYLYILSDKENLAGEYLVSPDGKTVTVRQSLPALWDKWGDLITGPDSVPTSPTGVVTEFLKELSEAAAKPEAPPPALPEPGVYSDVPAPPSGFTPDPSRGANEQIAPYVSAVTEMTKERGLGGVQGLKGLLWANPKDIEAEWKADQERPEGERRYKEKKDVITELNYRLMTVDQVRKVKQHLTREDVMLVRDMYAATYAVSVATHGGDGNNPSALQRAQVAQFLIKNWDVV
ncbi:hypothetical protein [Nocardia rhizosphaerae]|uniref:PH domain-containing protein n=1 Tax=Nocardia rhizosphaerae TaxID=1691571 RepID=A0ABV8KYV8_9NOCA